MNELMKIAYEDKSKILQYANKGLMGCEKQVIIPQLTRNDKVLDVGCFVGRVTFELSKLVDEIVGIDISETGIQYSNSQKEANGIVNAKFLLCSASNIPLSDKYFDKIIIPYNGIEDVSPESERQKVFVELEKKLSNKGVLIFSIHNKYYFRWYFHILILNAVRSASKVSHKSILKMISKFKNENAAKLLLSGEKDSIVWKEPDSKEYLQHFFYSHKKIVKQLTLAGFKIDRLISIEDQNPHSQEGLSKGVISKKLPSFLIPGFYIISSKVY